MTREEKVKEAIRELKQVVEFEEEHGNTDEDDYCGCITIRSARVAIKALERTEPQGVFYKGDGYYDGELVYDFAECPECDFGYEESDYIWGLPFCPKCGQALKWRQNMTREEKAIERLKTDIYKYADFTENPNENEFWMAFDMAIKALEQQTCEDAVSRETVLDIFADNADVTRPYSTVWEKIRQLPPVNPQSKMGHCKDCKYFEYDSVANIDGIPLIVAHEICSKWGDGCKTKEDGYCFLFEPQERSDKE